MAGWFRRLRARIKYRHFDRDLAREIETHRALKADEHRRNGAGDDEARHGAARDLGNVTLMREDARGVWIAPWLQSVWQDLRYAVASYRRQPLFTLGALLVLSLGTILVTTGFSLAHAVFLRPWRVPDPASVVILRAIPATPDAADYDNLSVAEFRYLREHVHGTEVFYSKRGASTDLVDGDFRLGQAAVLYVSDNYFAALRIPIAAGRSFTASDNDYQTLAPVAIISDGLWRKLFARNPAVIGRTVRVSQRVVTIVGVGGINSFVDRDSSGFDLALPLTALARSSTPSAMAVFTDARSGASGSAAGRIRPDASPGSAVAELTAASRQFRSAVGMPAVNVIAHGTAPVDRPSGSQLWHAARLILLALLLVLVLACANVGNMLLARGMARWREMAIRRSLGAGRVRLIRQLLTESALLAGAAGALGLAAASATPALLTRVLDLDEGFDRPEFYALTLPIYGFAAAITLAATMTCGLAPALRATRSIGASLDRHGPAASGVRLRRGLLAAQVALATLLLTGAGLLTRATAHALATDPGFAMNALHLISVDAPGGAARAAVARRDLLRGLDETLSHAGIAAAVVSRPPLSGSNTVIEVRQHQADAALSPVTMDVSARFFDVSGITLISGRAADAVARPREIVVSESAARKLWGDQDPVGRTLLEGAPPRELTPVVVVGVATDAAINSLTGPSAIVYRPSDYSSGYLLTRDGSAGTLDRIRAAAATLAPGSVVTSRPVTEQARRLLQRAFVGSRFAWAIGGLALVLAIVGAIGVFAFAVEERRREIGIRLALGAKPWSVIALVLRTSQATALAGLATGFGLSVGLGPLLRSYLYGLSPFDLRAYGSIALILFAAAAIASWAPARRAVRINPVETLRAD